MDEEAEKVKGRSKTEQGANCKVKSFRGRCFLSLFLYFIRRK